jgi:hypothetical protein
LCTVCNDIEGRTQCPWCMEPFPQMPNGHQHPEHNNSIGTQCLNLHALGEQWIEGVTDVDIVQTTPEECLEGEHLKFKAHIRGWKTMTRKGRCQNLLTKADHNLRQALLSAQWKDVLLVPQEWYPEHTPRYETKGWWYVSAEAVLGQTCKSCNEFCELADFAGTKRQRTVSVICYKCKFEEDRTGTTSERGQKKNAPRKRAALTLDGSTLRRSEGVQGQERVDYQEHS